MALISLTAEHGRSPNQLFTAGSLQLRNSGMAALDFFDSVSENYGIDNGLGVSMDSDEQGVEIPPTEIDLSSEQVSELESRINPLGESDDFGADHFIQTLHLVQLFTGN